MPAVIGKERCYYLDFAKVLTTFLVILGHLYSAQSGVRLYLYAFHMPVFFVISGVFHTYKGYVDWGKYCRTILWPIAVFIVIAILTNVLFFGESLSGQLREYFIDLPLGDVHGIIWFLFALFWCKVVLDIILSCRSAVFPIIICSLLLFVPGFVFRARLPLCLSNGMMAIPFYAAGFLGRDYLRNMKVSFKWILPFMLCLLLTVVITRLHGRVSMLSVSFGHLGATLFGDGLDGLPSFAKGLLKFGDVFLFYLNGFVGTAMILSLSLLPWPRLKIVTSLSQALITVVGIQYVFINVVKLYLGVDNNIFVSAALALLIFMICFVIHQLLAPLYRIFDQRR